MREYTAARGRRAAGEMLAVWLFLLIMIPQTGVSDDFTWSAGIGYDQISQGYYLSLIDTLTVDKDSILTLRQTADYVSDLRFKTHMDYTRLFSDDRGIRISNYALLSGDDCRNTLDATLNLGIVEFKDELDVRGIWETTDVDRNGHVSNDIDAELDAEITSGLFLNVRNSFEVTRYDGNSAFNYDYNYNRLWCGIRKEFGWTDLIELTYRYDSRSVPDSSRINLVRHRIRGMLEWSPTFDISISIDNELTRINSNKENGIDDGWEDYLETSILAYLSDVWRLEVRNQTEYFTYDTQDIVTFDYVYSTTELGARATVSQQVELFAKPSYAIFWSRQLEFDQQDFYQPGVEYGFDWIKSTSLWLTVSHKIAARNYTNPDESFYSDYLLNQLNLLADVDIFSGLRLNAVVSIDWEDHEAEENDNTLLLLSIGLEYGF